MRRESGRRCPLCPWTAGDSRRAHTRSLLGPLRRGDRASSGLCGRDPPRRTAGTRPSARGAGGGCRADVARPGASPTASSRGPNPVRQCGDVRRDDDRIRAVSNFLLSLVLLAASGMFDTVSVVVRSTLAAGSHARPSARPGLIGQRHFHRELERDRRLRVGRGRSASRDGSFSRARRAGDAWSSGGHRLACARASAPEGDSSVGRQASSLGPHGAAPPAVPSRPPISRARFQRQGKPEPHTGHSSARP